jgi:cell division protein FtsL
MTRTNFLLLFAIFALALLVVHNQQRQRNLFMELQREKDLSERLVSENSQLQLKVGLLTSSRRVEDGAVSELHMIVPGTRQTHVIMMDASSHGGKP